MKEIHKKLKNADPFVRLSAIQELGETGNLESLRLLREHNLEVAREHHALVDAIWKLKRKYFPEKSPPSNNPN